MLFRCVYWDMNIIEVLVVPFRTIDPVALDVFFCADFRIPKSSLLQLVHLLGDKLLLVGHLCKIVRIDALFLLCGHIAHLYLCAQALHKRVVASHVICHYQVGCCTCLVNSLAAEHRGLCVVLIQDCEDVALLGEARSVERLCQI